MMDKKTASAGNQDSDEKINDESGRGASTKSRRRNKKPKDMPRRPLSAYNLFFADEREKILSAQRRGVEQPDFVFPSEAELQHQASEGKKKAPVLFQALARCIGKRWKALDGDERKKYEARAKVEMKAYREKMEEYQQTAVLNSMTQSTQPDKPPASAKRGHEHGDDSDDSSEMPKKAARSSAPGDSPSKPQGHFKMPDDAVGVAGANQLGAGAMLPPTAGLSGLSQAAAFQQLCTQQAAGTAALAPAVATAGPSAASYLPSQLYPGLGMAGANPNLFPSGSLFHHQLPLQGLQSQTAMASFPQAAAATQNTSDFLLEQAMLQRQQQQAMGVHGAAAMGVPTSMGNSDLLALQLQQQQQQQTMGHAAGQSTLSYLLQQQQQQQQHNPYGAAAAASAGGLGASSMDPSMAAAAAAAGVGVIGRGGGFVADGLMSTQRFGASPTLQRADEASFGSDGSNRSGDGRHAV